MLMPCNQCTERLLRKAEVLAAGSDGSVHLLTKLLIAFVLRKIELCMDGLAFDCGFTRGWNNLRLKQVWLVGNLSLLE